MGRAALRVDKRGRCLKGEIIDCCVRHRNDCLMIMLLSAALALPTNEGVRA